jgi:hypothetical protein
MGLAQRKLKNGRCVTVKTRRRKRPTMARQKGRRSRIVKAQVREQTLMEIALMEFTPLLIEKE